VVDDDGDDGEHEQFRVNERTAVSTDSSRLDKRLEWLGAWSGIAWVIIAGAAFLGSGLVPARSPSMSAVEFANFVADHRYQILIGMLALLVGGYTFLMTWSTTLAYQVKKYANPSTLAFCVLFAVGLSGALIGMLCGVLGSAMAYRVDALDSATTQLLYDLILFLFLIPWPPFMLWQFITGFAILSSSNSEVVFPRWTGYFSMWAGALELFSALCVFFYNGPFSYNGLVTFWVPGASFFIWVLVMAIVQIKGVSRMKDSPLSTTVVKVRESEHVYEREPV
jgi:hypothetical protein